MKTIITHGVNFHSDDIFAVATLVTLLEKKLPKEKYKIIRTLDPKIIEMGDYVVDIGGVYNPKKERFDHHQEGGAGTRSNSVMYASFGLVWKKYGKLLSGSQYASDWIDRHIVQGIDAMDTGMYLYKPVIQDISPFLFQDYFKSVCNAVQNDVSISGELKKGNDKVNKLSAVANEKILAKKFDKEFIRMVGVAKDVLKVYITNSKQKESIHKKARAAYLKAEDKRIIIADEFIPSRFEDFKAPKYIEPLVFIYPNLRGGWSAKVVPFSDQTYESKILFPEKWRGKRDEDLIKITGVKDARFCHNGGFLAVADSKEGVLAMVRQVIK